MIKNVYISGALQRRPELRLLASAIAALGYSITASWLDRPEDEDDGDLTQPQIDELCAEVESDVADSDIFIAVTEDPGSPYTRGGRHVEFGMGCMFAGPCKLIVLGQPENLFHRRSGVERFDTVPQLLNYLEDHVNGE